MEGPSLHLSQINEDSKKFVGFLNVPYTTWASESTVADLERELAAQTGLRVKYIAYRGMRLGKSSQLSSLILDLDVGPCPRFSVHTTSGQNVFFVKSLNGKSVMMDLPLGSSTVKELKAEVEEVEKIPAEYQRFLYNGKHFADSEPITKTLHDYGVERDSTVQLLTWLRGGVDAPATVEFSDLQNTSALKVLPWSKTAPAWRLVDHGLNLEGKCENKSCAAWGHRVVCPKGFVAVNLVHEKAQCPVCKATVSVKTCSFTSCMWMFEGRKAVTEGKLVTTPSRVTSSRRWGSVTSLLTKCFRGKPPLINDGDQDMDKSSTKPSPNRDIVSAWFKASNQYEYFSQTKNMVQWENLIVVAKKSPTVSKNGPKVALPRDDSCSICFHKFDATTEANTHTTSCGHTFHAHCVESWLSCGGSACPVCRVDLVVEP